MNNEAEGLIDKVMIVIILFVAIIAIVAVYALVSIAGPVVVGEGKNAANIIQSSIDTSQPNSSISNASLVATSTVNGVLGTFELFVYLGFIGLFIGFMMICYYVRTYPFLSVFWFFIIIALVFISMLISNSYELASTSNSDMSSFYSAWGTNNFLMLNLPYIMAVFGVVSGVFLFVLISREPESEVQQI